jgi:hypothetical protein
MPNEKEQAELAVKTVNEFLSQFGEPDIYVQIMLEELFKELMNAKNLSILSQQEQKGHQISDSIERRTEDHVSFDGNRQFEPTENMDQSNPENPP